VKKQNRLVVAALRDFLRRRGASVADGLGPKLDAPLFRRIALIGLGLIGSSMARVARRKGISPAIVAADASAEVCARVRELGIADLATPICAAAVAGADLVILCVPVGAMPARRRGDRPASEAGAIVSDVGSVKGAVVPRWRRICRGARISFPAIPSPAPNIPARTRASPRCSSIAGALSRRRRAPTEAARSTGWKRSGARSGSNVEIMTAAHHDLVLAITSHVPHLIAYNIVGTADDLQMSRSRR
jgi:cyclohexadieny/prephenate dehydrogenase